MIGNVQLDYKFHFLKDLRINVNVGYELGRGNSSAFKPETNFEYHHLDGYVKNSDPANEKDNITFEAYLNYTKDIEAIDSKIDIIGGTRIMIIKQKIIIILPIMFMEM